MDADTVCVRPIEFQDGYLLPRASGAFNNSSLRMPAGSEALNRILEHIEDPEKIPYWMSLEHRRRLEASPPHLRLHRAGKLKRISFGPQALSFVITETGEDKYAAESDIYAPVPWWMTDAFFCPPGGAALWISDQTQVVHLSASRIGSWHINRIPLEGSFMRQMLDLTGYIPERLRS